MSRTGQMAWTIAKWVLVLGAIGWLLLGWLRRSHDSPGKLLTKWALTAPLLLLTFLAVPIFGPFGPFLIVACGVVFAFLWAPNIGAALARPLTSALDGGSEAAVAAPAWSAALARRARGDYAGALAAVREQLLKFPNDFDGQMLQASVHAENLGDLDSAALCVERIVNQRVHPPNHVAHALNQLADWHLKYGRDPDSARRALNRIGDLFPRTELAQQATQRLAHLPGIAHSAVGDARRIAVPQRGGDAEPTATRMPATPEEDAAVEEGELRLHLDQHPLDVEARERLAVLYAGRMGRVRDAVQLLDELVASPNQPARQVVRWLNLQADLLLNHAGDEAGARRALQRILERFPGSAAAEAAQSRLGTLHVAVRARESRPTLKLTRHEEDIGLKAGAPPSHPLEE